MNIDQAASLFENMLWESVQLGGPILLTALVVGMLISVFQVVTQIQEMTLTFVPKIIAIMLVLLLFGHWMLTGLVTYASALYLAIPGMVK